MTPVKNALVSGSGFCPKVPHFPLQGLDARRLLDGMRIHLVHQLDELICLPDLRIPETLGLDGLRIAAQAAQEPGELCQQGFVFDPV